jgi:hypothetical protein
MRMFLFVFLVVVSPVFAQDPSAVARAAAGCGPADVEFSVKLSKPQQASAPNPGKALVYVLEDAKVDDSVFGLGGITARVGLDGSWIGATGSQSFMSFPVDTGDHRVCVNWQSSLESRAKLGGALTITAEPGKIYYLRISVYATVNRDHPYDMELEAIDPAEAQFMMSWMSLSTSHPKK